MPAERKQLPKTRKRVTASARARISVRKSRKTVNSGLDESYLHKNIETVSNGESVTQPSTSSNSNDAIMAMLLKIKESNAVLARQMDKVEGHSSTPINLGSTVSTSHMFHHKLGPHGRGITIWTYSIK